VDVDFGNGQAVRRWPASIQSALTYVPIYALADIALNRFAFTDGWTILWPLNGVTVALLVMSPRAKWLPILFGVAVGTGIGEYLDGNPIYFEIAQRLISLIEVILSALFLPSFSTLNAWLRKPRIFSRFVASLLLGPGISGILASILFHFAQHEPYLLAFNNWATADALGIAATMPLALSIRSPEFGRLFERAALPRTIAVLTLALACAAMALSVSRYPLLFLLYPVLLLVDVQLAFAGSALAMFAVCLLAVYLATNHYGPFGAWPADLPVSRDIALQLYLGFQVVALFPASIRILERRRIAEELHDANVQLTMLASLDGLTGIANRRAFDDRFAQEWNRATRGASPLALAIIDIDHFKQFNDRYGHHAGDHALVSVAQALAGGMHRAADLVARFGGEEFVVLLPHTDLEGAAHLAEQLRLAVAGLAIQHQDSRWSVVTVSIGVAACVPAAPSAATPPVPAAAEDRFLLLTAADRALYQAKMAGRNCVEAGCDAREPVV